LATKVSRVKTIDIKNGPTGKVYRMTYGEEQSMRSRLLFSRIISAGWFEAFWYPIFMLSSIAAFIMILLVEKNFSIILLFSTLEILLSMVANNLVARGYRYALILSIIALIVYTYVAFAEKMWGEVIIHIVAFIPLEIAAFFQWKSGVSNDGKEKLEKINNTTLKQILFGLVIFAVGTSSVWAFLHFVLHQRFAIFNAVSIIAFLTGDILRNKRYKIFWYYFIIGNAAGIALWLCVSTNVTIDTIPLILSYAATLSNNVNGIFIWRKLDKQSRETKVYLLAKRDIKIKRILALKHEHLKYKYVPKFQPDVVKLNNEIK